MTFTKQLSLTLKGTITPADTLSGDNYFLGWNGTSFTVPAAADCILSRALACSTTPRAWEPDVNTFNSTTLPDANGVTVALDTVFAIGLYNTDSTNSVTFACANMDSGNFSGTLAPGGLAVIFFPSAGIAIGATSTITFTALAGTPTVNALLIGQYA